ncbi:MAG: response regulator transcription factor [Chitinispirillales bacterium]|jgi:two-component system alkaline phosphatase synthesis response regulator PhoP|nr:response regulator transcription factor [Chitinispirillales bacterium]
MITIYVVEDDDAIRELIAATLLTAEYAVKEFDSGAALFAYNDFAKADLYLLDIMLPNMDGYKILEKLKKSTDAPIIFLTAKGTEMDKATGLHLGADDYITKPFSVLELLARVKAMMRRCQKESPAKKLNFEKMKIDADSKIVVALGKSVKLTYKEFELLIYLAQNRGRVLSREQILSAVWGFDFDDVTTRTVDIHIKTLRQKIGDSAGKPLFIETVRGYGYKFVDNLADEDEDED